MLAQLLEVVDRTSFPAVAEWRGKLFWNKHAVALFDSAERLGEELARAVTMARHTGRLEMREVNGRQTLVIPLIESGGARDGVLIVQAPVEDLPGIYGQLVGDLASFSRFAQALPDIVLTARPDGRIDFWNRHFRLYADAKGPPSLAAFLAYVDFADGQGFARDWAAGMLAGARFEARLRLRRKDGTMRWHSFHAQPVLRLERHVVKWIVTLSDIHHEVEARNRAEASQKRLRFLAEASRTLFQSLDASVIAERACRHATEWLAVEAAVTLADFGESVSASMPHGGGAAKALREADWLTDAATTFLENSAGTRYVLVPLFARKRPIGALCVGFAHESGMQIEDVELIEEFSRRVAVAFDNAGMYTRERRTATTLQDMLLPAALPQPYGMRIDSAYLPAGDEARVGGDWYDAFELHDGSLAISIGDIGGHGVQASAVMGAVRQTIRTALLGGSTPSRALALANDVVYEQEPRFATAFVGLVDTVGMTIRYATAGHPMPVVVNDDGGTAQLVASGMALGIRNELGVLDFSSDLPRSGALALYTDGMIEYARDGIAGEARLIALLSKWGRQGKKASAVQLAAEFLGDARLTDDAAMLLVRFTHVHELDLVIAATPRESANARRALLRFAREWSIDAERARDLLLACAEAVNNAIEHAYGGQAGTVRLRARKSGDRFIMSVEDAGRWKNSSPQEHRGRGLFIMKALADQIEVQRRDDGTTVQVVFNAVQPGLAERPFALSESAE